MRRLLPLILASLLLPVPAQAAPAHVNHSAFTSAVGSTCTISGYTANAAGNGLAVVVVQIGSGVRTYSVADDVVGAYTPTVELAGTSSARYAGLFHLFNVTTATRTITVTQGGGSASNFSCQLFEFTEANAVDAIGSNEETVATTSHVATAGVNTSADAFVIVAAVYNGSSGTQTAGSGYTATLTTTASTYSQYGAFASPQGSHTGPWTTSTARTAIAVIASFDVAGGGGGGGAAPRLLLLGVGR